MDMRSYLLGLYMARDGGDSDGGDDTPQSGTAWPVGDGKTRFWIKLGSVANPVSLRGTLSGIGTVTVDWGDESANETATGSAVSLTHQYETGGKYVIALDVTEGATLALSGISGGGPDTKTFLREMEIGDYVTSLPSPSGSNYTGLRHAALGKSMIATGTMLRYAHALETVLIPEGVRNIAANAFTMCYSLTEMTIPATVTNIYASAFMECENMAAYHLLPETPPTLANTNAFNYIPSDCVIYVPKGCLETYQTATNWSSYASYMREEP